SPDMPLSVSTPTSGVGLPISMMLSRTFITNHQSPSRPAVAAECHRRDPHSSSYAQPAHVDNGNLRYCSSGRTEFCKRPFHERPLATRGDCWAQYPTDSGSQGSAAWLRALKSH